MSRRLFSPDQDKLLAAEYEAGATYRQLAERYGGSDVAVRSAVRRGGGKSRDPIAAHSSALAAGDPDARAEALRLYREGWSVRKLAAHFHANGRIISTLLAEAGVKLHPGSYPRFRTEDECRAVADRYNAGASLAELAAVFGCSTPAITRAVVLGGGRIRAPGVSKVWTPEVIAWAAKEYNAGRSQGSIAEELGVNQTAVSKYLRKSGAIPPSTRSGSAHHGWKGGRIVVDGYVYVTPTADDLAYCIPNSGGYIGEHRLVMGRHLGRPVLPSETVHHKDGDHGNNGLSNLQLRQGRHGKGVVFTCSDCGSHRVTASEIAD